MTEGVVVSIHVASEAGARPMAVPSVRAVAGQGLEGDRYFLARGTYSDKPGKDRQVTLIEVEAVEALERECGVRLEPGDSRRNVVTRDVALNHLVGRTFQVGDARLRGIRLCEPCAHLAEMTEPKVLPGLIHRGGLRAEIVSDGTIRPGDAVRLVVEERV